MIAPMEPVGTGRHVDTFELTIEHKHGRWSAKFVVAIDGQRHGGILTDASDRGLLEFTNDCGTYLMALDDSLGSPSAALALVLT